MTHSSHSIALAASKRLAISSEEGHAGSAQLRAAIALRQALGGRSGGGCRFLGWIGADLMLQRRDTGGVFLVDLVLDEFKVLVGSMPQHSRWRLTEEFNA